MLKLLLTGMATRLMAQNPDDQGGSAMPDDHTVDSPTDELKQFAAQGQAAQAAADAAIAQTSAQSGTGARIDEDAAAVRAAEEKARADFPEQTVVVRAQPGSDKLGLVINRGGGGWEAHELAPRHAKELVLKAGDQLVVLPLQGRDRDEYMKIAGMCSDPA